MTIKDIAKISGVSVSTVSRVLNNHPDVSEDVRHKVMAVVEEYNYIPNNSARALGQSKSDNIGLIVRGISNPFYTSIIHEIEQDIEKAGYTLVMQQIGSCDDELLAGAMMERDKRLRGLIFLGGRLDSTKDQIAGIGVPFVNCSSNNAYGTLDADSYSSVSIDDTQTAYEAVKELYKEGHRRIAVLLARPDDGSVSQIRYEGYVKALTEAGMAPDEDLIISVDSYNIADAYYGTKKWLEKGIAFDAIFAIADNLAMGAMRALREKGIDVPGQCSIVAIDGIEVSEYMAPALSTYCQPMKELGRTSVELLIDLIEKKGKHRQIILPTIFREGGTISARK
ncbi:MAG: LacI family DNA-binding transcriptional regulator [Lachnospiraceae bacterium]|nr:LacI family DNA-binding transcriptional regulator [Lachnospiraceae bacterium]